MQHQDSKKLHSKSIPKLAVVPKSQSKPTLRLEGHAPSAEMLPGKYLARCESAWLEPIGKSFRAVLQFRTVDDGKFGGIALRMWMTVSDGGGVISRTSRYVRACQIALRRPVETDDPIDDPAQIFLNQNFLLQVGYRKTEGLRGGMASAENAQRRKDDRDFLRVHEIISREELLP